MVQWMMLSRDFKDYHIRRCRVFDLFKIAQLEKMVFPEPLSIFELLRIFILPGSHYIVITYGPVVTAYIGFKLFEHIAHTISMAVHPNHRRKGLAGLVQGAANKEAASRGAKWFTGEVRLSNHAQLKFLQGEGWQEIGVCPRFFSDGEDAVVVHKWLV